MARIDFETVTKRFGKVLAVDGLELEIEDGRVTALLGPSGCGKTTTLRMLAGFERPSAGEIRFDGRRVNEALPRHRDIGFVFQNYALFTHMSVFANIALPLKARKLGRQEIEKEVGSVARLLDIGDLLHVRASRLSVNAAQKVALGRSMITRPAIFLLDEPLSNLDAAFREFMRAELKRLQRELGQTMVYVTHDQVEAMSLADRIAILNEGRLQQYGTPDEVYNHPRNSFVARFVGSTTMNFLPVTDASDNGRCALRLPIEGSRPVEVRRREALLDALGRLGQLTLGVRPEHVSLVSPDAPGADFRGRVLLVEPLGAKTVVHVAASAHVVRVLIGAEAPPREGENVGAVLDQSFVHVFDSSAEGTALQ